MRKKMIVLLGTIDLVWLMGSMESFYVKGMILGLAFLGVLAIAFKKDGERVTE